MKFHFVNSLQNNKECGYECFCNIQNILFRKIIIYHLSLVNDETLDAICQNICTDIYEVLYTSIIQL